MLGKYYAPSKFNTFELKKNYAGVEPSMERPGEWVSINTNEKGFIKIKYINFIDEKNKYAHTKQ